MTNCLKYIAGFFVVLCLAGCSAFYREIGVDEYSVRSHEQLIGEIPSGFSENCRAWFRRALEDKASPSRELLVLMPKVITSRLARVEKVEKTHEIRGLCEFQKYGDHQEDSKDQAETLRRLSAEFPAPPSSAQAQEMLALKTACSEEMASESLAEFFMDIWFETSSASLEHPCAN